MALGFWWIELNLLIALGRMAIFSRLILPIPEHSTSFRLLMSSSLFLQCLTFLTERSFISPVRFIPKCFVLLFYWWLLWIGLFLWFFFVRMIVLGIEKGYWILCGYFVTCYFSESVYQLYMVFGGSFPVLYV